MKALVHSMSVLILAAVSAAVSVKAQDNQVIRSSNRPPADAAIAARRDPEVHIVVELVDKSAAEVVAEKGMVGAEALSSGRAQIARLRSAQSDLIAQVKSKGISARLVYSAQRALNGVVLLAKPEAIDTIRALPGVKSAKVIKPAKLNADSSIPLLNVKKVWDKATLGLGATGKGVKVGIIDSGIDYIHTAFGGSGTGYDLYDPNDQTLDGPFPTAKVVGGFDFAGDDYDADGTPEQQIPHPDPDPMDCNGHGTACASLVGSFGVNADGATYTGPYDQSTDIAALKISPGMAPDALLYALRVFGCDGSTSLVAAAIDWALDPNGDGDLSDHLDIISMSLGSPDGTLDDDTAIAASNAAKLGVITVASAGNEEDSYYVVGSPSVGPRVISVAASINDMLYRTLRVTAPQAVAGDYIATPAAFGGPIPSELTGELAFDTTNPDGCGAFAVGALSGKIAVIRRGTCNFVVKVKAAQEAGAVAAVVVNNVPGTPITMGAVPPDPTITIPAVMITQADGEEIIATLATEPVTASLRDETVPNSGDTIADYSSRGPARNGAMLKPDITAPAEGVSVAVTGTGNDVAGFSGTSSSCPHVAGVLALLKQLHPNWTPAEFKAAVMNSASHPIYALPFATPPKQGISRTGVGRIDAAQAGLTNVLVSAADEPGVVGLSFGAPQVTLALFQSKSVKVTNKTPFFQIYDVSFESINDAAGVEFKVIGRRVVVPPLGTAEFPVLLLAKANQMKRNKDPLVAATQVGLPRHFLTEETGLLKLTPLIPIDPVAHYLPVYAAPRPASLMKTLAIGFNNQTPGPINLVRYGIQLSGQNDLAVNYQSLVKYLELQDSLSLPQGLSSQQKAAALRYVGVTSDYPARGDLAQTVLGFGVASHGESDTPSDTLEATNAAYEILIDNNLDGTADYVVVNWVVFDGEDPTNVYLSASFNLTTGEGFLEEFINGVSSADADTAIFNSRVQTLYVSAANVGVTGRFNYRVAGYYLGELISATLTLTYDPTNPGVSLVGAGPEPFLSFDSPGTSTVQINPAGLEANDSLGILALHLHNSGKDQAEAILPRGQRIRGLKLPSLLGAIRR